MLAYQEIEFNTLENKDVYVYGAGNWGRICKRYLEKNGIKITNFVDRDENKVGTDWDELKILSVDELLDRDCEAEIVVIVAMLQYHDAYNFLSEKLKGTTCFYLRRRLYQVHGRTILGTCEDENLVTLLRGKKKHVVGSGKYKEDFMYIYADLGIGDLVSEDIPEKMDEDDLLILCSFDRKEAELSLPKGCIYNVNYIFGEDLFCLLDKMGMPGVPGIPSVMMHKTLYDPMLDQYICKQAFYNLQISSRFSVHCCCSDWGDEVGNLGCSTIDEIWNSINLKIFRLSLINRTYSFCNRFNCVHLETEADTTTRRIADIPQVKPYSSYLEIGIDRTCNLYCESCREEVCVESGDKKKKIEEVKNSIIESGWLDKVDNLLLGGQGEVFFSQVYRDLMFKNAGNRKALNLRTNGTLLDKTEFLKLKSIYEKLAITVSIDAATKETYDQLRRSHNKDTWDNLMNNLEFLAEMRKKGELSHFQINMCVQMKNYKEIPDFISMGKRLGVDVVYITPIRNWGTYSSEEFRNVEVMDKNKQVKEEVRAVLENPILREKIVNCVL